MSTLDAFTATGVTKEAALVDSDVSGASPHRAELLEQYRRVRQFSERLCETLEPEDYVIQPRMEMSPTKWHLAHTSWFFETFVAKPYLSSYRPLNPQYAFLFNSYYNSVGKMHLRSQRGLISRPTVRDTYLYRQHVNAAMEGLLESADETTFQSLAPLVVLGLNHEQQHQELILTDIKHVFWTNPLRPIFRPENSQQSDPSPTPLGWRHFEAEVYSIGSDGMEFCFDNETPRHRVFLESFSLATRLVTNEEFLNFIDDGGYERSELWLSLGWTTVNERGWNAPLYWEKRDGDWWMMTLAGMRRVRLAEPVCHLSYFEADAYARWAGARLPSEAEWEIAAQHEPLDGHFAESGNFHPAAAASLSTDAISQMFGEVWQWTQSAYSPYPGYQPRAGALGEYNGKFMCNQYVLRGASCATPRFHARRTYRNFFPPNARWQFAGLRLAKDQS